MDHKINIDDLITHTMKLEDISTGEVIREATVVRQHAGLQSACVHTEPFAHASPNNDGFLVFDECLGVLGGKTEREWKYVVPRTRFVIKAIYGFCVTETVIDLEILPEQPPCDLILEGEKNGLFLLFISKNDFAKLKQILKKVSR